MKKFAILLMLAVLVLSSCQALALDIDWETLTNDEVNAIVDAARNEQTKRELVAGGKVVLFDTGEISAYMTGELELSYELKIEIVLINNSGKNISMFPDGIYINGWGVSGTGLINIMPGKKQKNTIGIIDYENSEIESIDDIEEIEFSFRIVDSDSFDTLETIDPVRVEFQ